MRADKSEYLKGTTTVGVVCRDGVVLATDTRATGGYLIASKEAKKIYKITDTIAFTTAGSVADTQKLVDLLRAEAAYYQLHEGAPMGVTACARLLANILNSSSLFPFIANFLVGGLEGDKPKLFFLDIDGGLTEEEMTATGSGSSVAYGVLESEIKKGMKIDEVLPIVVKAIKTAMKRDIATGNEVMVAVIDRGGYREIPPASIKSFA
ncbi:MAG: archaeal proteasome endopeptidase complex subunit beta [Candidatus Hadarchaeales archaeon]